MFSVRPYGAGPRELAWPILGATAFAIFATLLLRYSSVKPWPGRTSPQEEAKPETRGRTKELQDFVYDSLPQSSEAASHAIRLLRIHFGDAGTQPNCSLETFNFDACPEYWALSYTWGPETPSDIILVNGQRFRVRQNLFNFITAFRSPYNDDFYLWIDQICINQDNIPERNSQVRRMGQYYDRAIKVIIWLGIGSEIELAALDRINQVDIVNTPPSKYKEAVTLDLLRGYRSIIANSYFERLWIVQEMARAQEILVMLGTDTQIPMTTSWRHFNFAFVQLVFEKTITSTTSEAAQKELMLRQEIRDRSEILFQLLEVKKHRDSTDIFELIEAFSSHKCADSRDKLFALQDIGHLQRQLFTIDYSKSKNEVYSDFVGTCLNSSKIGYTLSERQFDVLLRLGQTMGIQVEVQYGPAGTRSGSIAPDVEAEAVEIILPKEAAEKLTESIDYVKDRDVLTFGPRYDKETGHRVSPLSHEAFRNRIPTIFEVPASVNLKDISKTAKKDLYRRLGVSPHAQPLASDDEGASGVDEPSNQDGYTTIVSLSGDFTHLGLPASDTNE